MELMSISLDKFYKFVHDHLGDSIPEDILGKITVAVILSPQPTVHYISILYCICIFNACFLFLHSAFCWFENVKK